MQIAILGLPLMGRILTDKLLADGHEVVVWNNQKEELEQIRTEKAEFVVNQKLTIIHSIEELRNILRKPRVLLSMQDAGEPTESLLNQLNNLVEAGDIIIDCADSHFKDTNRRFEACAGRGVKYLGIGIAGGINALENGTCLMIGGDADAYQYITPILEALTKPNGIHTYFGSGGAGHYVKMVHNGIELGMAQAIAEGISLLNKSDYQLDPGESVYTWQEGSIISSFMLDMVLDVLARDSSLSAYSGNNQADLLVNGIVDYAKEKNLLLPVINQALEFQKRSQYDNVVQGTFTAKIIQAMRAEWNGKSLNKVESEI
jgi:6-phosphogluconate dehydrogenase